MRRANLKERKPCCGSAEVKLLFLPAPTHRQLTAAYDGITALFALKCSGVAGYNCIWVIRQYLFSILQGAGSRHLQGFEVGGGCENCTAKHPHETGYVYRGVHIRLTERLTTARAPRQYLRAQVPADRIINNSGLCLCHHRFIS